MAETGRIPYRGRERIANSGVSLSRARTLDTNFTPSSTSLMLCIYTINLPANGQNDGVPVGCSVELRSDASTTPTTIRCKVSNTGLVSATTPAGTTFFFTNTIDAVLTYLVPPGHRVRLVSAGAAGPPTIVQQVEVAIGSANVDPIIDEIGRPRG